jgi:predicted MPP superfamily phosphohydrolase
MIIAHISDLHIKSLQRHDEFKEVSSYLLNDIEEQKADHAYIAGDIFHTKTTGISPEYIDVLAEFLTELANRVPVHIILGNHDGVTSNLSRQDAVSPIVTALNNDRIHLYKNSGTYQFAKGYNWCVFSIFDKDNWIEVEPVKDEVNIACYHGPVKGMSMPNDAEDFIQCDVSLDFFKEYDMVMLGDIHIHQFFGHEEMMLDVDEAELVNYPDAKIIE